jgi:hypothetical protein
MTRARAAAVSVVAVLAAAVAAAGEREDAIIAAMRLPAADLERALATSPWRDEPLFLAAVAQNSATTSAMLDAIARRRDRALHERLYAPTRVLGKNRQGLAVMRLVAQHPNVTEATPVHLAASPNEYVINTVLGNPKTPEAVLRRSRAATTTSTTGVLRRIRRCRRICWRPLRRAPTSTRARRSAGTRGRRRTSWCALPVTARGTYGAPSR